MGRERKKLSNLIYSRSNKKCGSKSVYIYFKLFVLLQIAKTDEEEATTEENIIMKEYYTQQTFLIKFVAKVLKNEKILVIFAKKNND